MPIKIMPDDIVVLQAVIVERVEPNVIAERMGISRERVRQRYSKFGVSFRPQFACSNPALVNQALGINYLPVADRKPAMCEHGYEMGACPDMCL